MTTPVIQRAEVTSGVTGEKVPANILRCACGQALFYCWQIEGQDHWHLECRECSTSYCPQGACT